MTPAAAPAPPPSFRCARLAPALLVGLVVLILMRPLASVLVLVLMLVLVLVLVLMLMLMPMLTLMPRLVLVSKLMLTLVLCCPDPPVALLPQHKASP